MFSELPPLDLPLLEQDAVQALQLLSFPDQPRGSLQSLGVESYFQGPDQGGASGGLRAVTESMEVYMASPVVEDLRTGPQAPPQPGSEVRGVATTSPAPSPLNPASAGATPSPGQVNPAEAETPSPTEGGPTARMLADRARVLQGPIPRSREETGSNGSGSHSPDQRGGHQLGGQLQPRGALTSGNQPDQAPRPGTTPAGPVPSLTTPGAIIPNGVLTPWAQVMQGYATRVAGELLRGAVHVDLCTGPALERFTTRVRQTLTQRVPGVTTPPSSPDRDPNEDTRRRDNRGAPPDEHPGIQPQRRPRDEDDPGAGRHSGGSASSVGLPPNPRAATQTHQAPVSRRGSVETSGSAHAQAFSTGASVILPVEAYMVVNVNVSKLDPILELLEPAARAMMAQKLRNLPAHRGNRARERVRAPIFHLKGREVLVNGKPLQGVAILDTGAMPLLIGKPGVLQLGLKPKDVIEDAVRLGLADGKASALFGVTREPLFIRFNPGTRTETTLHVRAVATEATYDFLIGNVVL